MTTLDWMTLDHWLCRHPHNPLPLTTPCTSISRCAIGPKLGRSKYLTSVFSSTSIPFYTRLPRPIRRLTLHLLSLSCPSNPTPTPSLAADKRLFLPTQGLSCGERTATCLMGRPVRQLQALLIFTSDRIHASKGFTWIDCDSKAALLIHPNRHGSTLFTSCLWE